MRKVGKINISKGEWRLGQNAYTRLAVVVIVMTQWKSM